MNHELTKNEQSTNNNSAAKWPTINQFWKMWRQIHKPWTCNEHIDKQWTKQCMTNEQTNNGPWICNEFTINGNLIDNELHLKWRNINHGVTINLQPMINQWSINWHQCNEFTNNDHRLAPSWQPIDQQWN